MTELESLVSHLFVISIIFIAILMYASSYHRANSNRKQASAGAMVRKDKIVRKIQPYDQFTLLKKDNPAAKRLGFFKQVISLRNSQKQQQS